MLCPITVQVSEGSALEDYNRHGPHRTGVLLIYNQIKNSQSRKTNNHCLTVLTVQ